MSEMAGHQGAVGLQLLASVMALALAAGCDSSDDGNGSSSSSSGSGGPCEIPWGPSGCDWPSGVTFGTDEGDTLGPGFEWEGYAEGCSVPSTITIQDFYDCDGALGLNAIYLTSSRFNCGSCQQESAEMQAKIESSWQALGIKVVVAVIHDENDQPADIDDVLAYKNEYGLDGATLIADPGLSFLGGATIDTPHVTIVNPRTMEVAAVQEGYPGPYAAVESLAQQNASN